MAKASTLKAEHAKQQSEKKAAVAAGDPSKLTWDEYKAALREQKGSALSPTNLKVAREKWDAANPKPVETPAPPKEVKKPTVKSTTTTTPQTTTTTSGPGLGVVNPNAEIGRAHV